MNIYVLTFHSLHAVSETSRNWNNTESVYEKEMFTFADIHKI